MGYKDITAGEKIARPIKARFIESKQGTMGLEVAFSFEQNGKHEQMSWVGWLSPKARDNTMKTLVEVLGYNGSLDTDAERILTDPHAFNWQQDVKLVVEPEEYEGKTRMKIKWVNKIGGSAFAGCTPEIIKSKLDASGFRAAFLAAKAGAGKPAAPALPKAMQSAPMEEDDLGF